MRAKISSSCYANFSVRIKSERQIIPVLANYSHMQISCTTSVIFLTAWCKTNIFFCNLFCSVICLISIFFKTSLPTKLFSLAISLTQAFPATKLRTSDVVIIFVKQFSPYLIKEFDLTFFD